MSWKATIKNRASGEPALDAIMRAKVNCRVYEDHIADPNEAKRRGAPIKYDAYSIFDFFETRKDQFHELEIEIDGVKTTQQVYSQIIKWGRNKEKHELKFVLSQRGEEQIVLASTDLELSDEDIIRIYNRRFTIEVSFRQGTELFGLFNSRFHTHCLEPFNFYASKEDPTPVSKISSEADKKKVLATVKATEGFALHAMLAMNLTRLYQCQAMKDPGERKMYLRTYSQNFSLQETKQELSTAIICSLTRGEEKEINSLLSQPEPPVYSTKECLITDRGNKRIIRRVC